MGSLRPLAHKTTLDLGQAESSMTTLLSCCVQARVHLPHGKSRALLTLITMLEELVYPRLANSVFKHWQTQSSSFRARLRHTQWQTRTPILEQPASAPQNRNTRGTPHAQNNSCYLFNISDP